MNKPANRLTVAQAARELGISERTLRRRVAEGKIEAVKDATPQTGVAWFIERATVDALSKPAPDEEEKEVEQVEHPAPVEPERNAQAPRAEIVRLRDEVREIRCFLIGQETAEDGEQAVAPLRAVIEQAIHETLAPMIERIERQSAENTLLQEQLAQALEREREATGRPSNSRWPFSKRS